MDQRGLRACLIALCVDGPLCGAPARLEDFLEVAWSADATMVRGWIVINTVATASSLLRVLVFCFSPLSLDCGCVSLHLWSSCGAGRPVSSSQSIVGRCCRQNRQALPQEARHGGHRRGPWITKWPLARGTSYYDRIGLVEKSTVTTHPQVQEVVP